MSKTRNIYATIALTGVAFLVTSCQTAQDKSLKHSVSIETIPSNESIAAKLIATELDEADSVHRIPADVYIDIRDVPNVDGEELRSHLSKQFAGQRFRLLTTAPVDMDAATVVRLENVMTVDQVLQVDVQVKWGPRLGYGVRLWMEMGGVEREVAYQL